MSQIDEEYQALLRSYLAAVASGDPAAAAGHYLYDAILLLPGVPALLGRTEIEAHYATTLGDGIKLDVRYAEIQDFDETICITGTTESDDLKGQWLEVLKRNKDGNLRIFRLCFNEI